MESKCGDTAAGLVLEELEVIEGASATVEARENVFPAGLVLVDVRKLDVGVL